MSNLCLKFSTTFQTEFSEKHNKHFVQFESQILKETIHEAS